MNLKNAFRLLLFICVVIIFFLATTSTSIPVVSHSNDKINHIMAFLTLTFFADMSTGREVTKRIKKITITLILYGLLIEIVQWQLPYRSFSIADLAADLFAISSYWALAFVAPIFFKRLH
ncbi:MAG: VanZ family protein [Pseudomonadales bacterium]|nr:VanZ family protein [Pseudomonadales bacterium]